MDRGERSAAKENARGERRGEGGETEGERVNVRGGEPLTLLKSTCTTGRNLSTIRNHTTIQKCLAMQA